MKSVLCLCLLALAAVNANPLFDFDSEEEIEPMIVNGRAPTDIDPTAHAVVLFATRKTDQTTGQLGGGSIIGPRAVLTAAHLVRKRTLVRIGYGSNTLAQMRVTESRVIVEHPKFNVNTRANDIAILFTVDSFDLTLRNVQAIRLPVQDRNIKNGVVISTVGFGFTAATGQTGPTSQILVASVTTVPNRVCEQIYRRQMTTFICARDKRAERAANVCLGDNGNGIYMLSESEVPKPETPKPEVPKPEVPKPGVPKPEAPKPEAPKPEAPKPEAPKPEAPKPEAPKPEAPKPEPAKPVPPKQEREDPAQSAQGEDDQDPLSGFHFSRKRRETPNPKIERRPILVGIASVFGSECTPGRASGYTRVSSYSDWINEEVRKHASKQEGEREDGEKGQ